MRAPLAVLSCLAVSAGASLHAEVRATRLGPALGAAILCDCASSSPLVWQPHLTPISDQALNPTGASSGDHPPALAIGSGSGTPIAVWAEWDGHDYELVFSQFDGITWSPVEWLTDNSIDDTEPSIASRETGSAAIAWRASSAVAQIQYRQREPSGAWSPIVAVSTGAQPAANPVVLAWNGRVRVAFVEQGSGGSKLVTVALGGETDEPWPPMFQPEVIAATYWSGELEPGLFSAQSGPISIWTDSELAIGFSRFNGVSWSAPQFEPYAGAPDLERARIRAKRRAMHGP